MFHVCCGREEKESHLREEQNKELQNAPLFHPLQMWQVTKVTPKLHNYIWNPNFHNGCSQIKCTGRGSQTKEILKCREPNEQCAWYRPGLKQNPKKCI